MGRVKESYLDRDALTSQGSTGYINLGKVNVGGTDTFISQKSIGYLGTPGVTGQDAAQTSTGLRYNDGKMRPTLISPHALQGLMAVLEFGARKYAPRNWERGLPGGLEPILDSLLRHVFAMMRGEEVDQESGLPHIDHVLCNAMFYSHLSKVGPSGGGQGTGVVTDNDNQYK